MELKDLEVYVLARDISRDAWKIYNAMDWRSKKIIGDQFISAIDSIGANIAEGFGRFHFLDRNRFNYNARGSLIETLHWIDLLIERNVAPKEEATTLKTKLEVLKFKLNNFINSIKQQANSS
jgi:four helix bundle protein